jgi:hypothetical protein
MRKNFSRQRFFAAVAASLAFAATFAVSARAVIDERPVSRIYKVVVVDSLSERYYVGQAVEIPTTAGEPADFIEIADGVWGELQPETPTTPTTPAT